MLVFRSLLPACLLLALLLGLTPGRSAAVQETRPDQVDQAALARIFSGGERLRYAVSWSGGVKIGDIDLAIKREHGRRDSFTISAHVQDYGPLRLIYPVDDTFSCSVSGPMRLPFRYEVVQREGHGGRETKRLTWYDQKLKYVRYQKNDGPFERFDLDGTVYNEFASFIITRALRFTGGEEIVVPTFADRKRHEVRVSLLGRERLQTLFGEQPTLKVQPRMHFKGLYDKDGDTVLWITDDQCRVPVEIRSRIVVGSLVATLTEYENPACPELRQRPAP